jgi:hypothetical protein
MSGATAEAVTAIVFDAAPAQAGAAQVEAAGKKIIDTNTAVVNATTRTVDVQANMERALARLTRQIDPAAAAQAKLEQGQRLLERALQRGTITADEQARRLALLDDRYAAAAAGAGRLAAANDNVTRSSSVMGQRLGAAGFQLQDFIVQVQGGQSVLTALSQQGSQFLGAFGTAGAVLGAGLTVGILATQFAGLTGQVTTLNDAIEVQSDLFKEADARAKAYGADLEDQASTLLRLTEGYRSATEQARAFDVARLTQAQNGLATQRGLLDTRALNGIIDRSSPTVTMQVTDAMGNISGTFEQVRQLTPAMQLLRQALDEFGSRAIVTSEDVATLYARLVTLDGGSRQANDAIRASAGALLAAAPEYKRLEDAQREGAIQMLALQQAAGASGAELDRYAARFGNLAVQIRQAAASLAAMREGAIGQAENRLLVEVQRNEAVLAAIRSGGRDAGQAMQDRGERSEQIMRQAQQLSDARKRELEQAGRSADDVRESLREAQGEFIGLATRSVDASSRVTEGLKRQAAGAREVNDEFGELRRNSQGLLVATRQDELAVRSILGATNNSILDPDKLKEGRDLARRVIDGARTDTEKYSETVTQLTDALNRGAISQDTFNQAVAAANPAVKQAQQAANQIESTFSGAFTRAFEAGADAGKSFLDSIARGVKSLAATIGSQLIFRMAVVPVVNYGASALGFSGSLLGAPNTAIGGLNLGGMFGGGTTPSAAATGGTNVMGQAGNASSLQTITGGLRGINPGDYISGATSYNTGFGYVDSALNTSLWGTSAATQAAATNTALGGMGGIYGPASMDAVTAAGGSATGISGGTIGSVGAGALGVAGGLYGLYSGIQRGGVGGYTSAAGGAAAAGLSGAALAGLSVPVYGWIAAAVLSVVGALLPGQKPSGKGQETAIDFASGDSNWRGLTGDRYSAGNREQSETAARSIATLANQLGDALGGIRLQGSTAVGVTQSQLYLRVGEQRDTFGNNEDGAKALADKAAEFLLNEFRKSVSGDFVGILNASPTVEVLQQNLDWYNNTYLAFGKSAEAASAYQQALDQVTASFRTNIDKANELALSTDVITAARDKELAKVTAARDLNVRAFDIGLDQRIAAASGASGLTSQLAGFDIAADQQRAQVKQQIDDWGLSAERSAELIAKNEQALAAERLKIQQDYADQAAGIARQSAADIAAAQKEAGQSAASVISSLADYARGLAYSDKSALSAQDQYSLALGQYNAVSGAALAGDAGSLSKLKDYSDTLLGASRAMNGSGAAYASDFSRVADVLSRVGNLSADTLTASYFAQITMQAQEASANTVVAAIRDLQASVESLRTWQTQQDNAPARAA